MIGSPELAVALTAKSGVVRGWFESGPNEMLCGTGFTVKFPDAYVIE
jgi:hypothetical protein